MFPGSADFEVVYEDEASDKGVICYRAFKRGDAIAHMNGELNQFLLP